MPDIHKGRECELYYKNMWWRLDLLYLLKILFFICFQSTYNTLYTNVGVLLEMHLSQEIENCMSQEISSLQSSGLSPHLILSHLMLSHFFNLFLKEYTKQPIM